VSTSLLEVKGIGPAAAKLLVDHGITCTEDLAGAKLGVVMAVQGFSEIRASRVIDAAKALLNGVPAFKKEKAGLEKAAGKKVGKIASAQMKKDKKEKKAIKVEQKKKDKKDKKDNKDKKDKKKKKSKKEKNAENGQPKKAQKKKKSDKKAGKKK
jgi:hypothetical protein